MNTTSPVTAKTDISNCDREQIQYAGAILPHGVLLVLREPEFTVVQASQNTGTLFGIEPQALLGNTLHELHDAEAVAGILEKLRADPLPGPPTRIATVKIHGAAWNVLAHRYDQVVCLEFEPCSTENQVSVLDLYSQLRPAIARLRSAESSQEFLDVAGSQIRAFTGFDRVMAYKFCRTIAVWSVRSRW
jgi:chemotaxis family two-component system sensor kinase Cph1